MEALFCDLVTSQKGTRQKITALECYGGALTRIIPLLKRSQRFCEILFILFVSITLNVVNESSYKEHKLELEVDYGTHRNYKACYCDGCAYLRYDYMDVR